MQECGSFTFQFTTKEEAEMVANTIKEWAEENLTFYGWISQLFPVSENFLFVGNNAAMNYFEWDIKISKLPDVVLTKHPTRDILPPPNTTWHLRWGLLAR